MSLDKVILAASDKDYIAFAKELQIEVDKKMSATVGSFIKYLDKNSFTKEK